MKSHRISLRCFRVAAVTIGAAHYPYADAGERNVAPAHARRLRAAAHAMKTLVSLALVALPAFAAFPNGYSYCKVVTTSHAMVSGTNDLANYPLTVILTDADLRTSGNGGLVNNSNGYDIGFYPDCSGFGTALKWEMESYSATTGAIVAHVLRPTLSHTTNDAIGMFYGGSFSSFQSTASAVWDSTYKGVWHLANPTNPTDSTGSSNGTNHGSTATTGQIDGGAAFVAASSQYATAPLDLSGTAIVTLEFWLNQTAFSNNDALQFEFTSNVNSVTTGFIVDGGSSAPASGKFVFGFKGNGSVGGFLEAAFTRPTTGAWHHYALIMNKTAGANSVTPYVDGVTPTGLQTGLTGFSDTSNSNNFGNSTLYFMSRNGASLFNGGSLDEVRVSTIARSADWVLTGYRNQSAPGTYISAGPRTVWGATHVRHVVTGGA